MVKDSYQRRREKVLAQKAEYRERNREKIIKSRRTYWRKNREKLLAKIRAYASANRQKLNAAKREARLANPKKQREISARYRLKHPERIARFQREGYQRHKQKRVAWEYQYRRTNINRKVSVSLRNRLNAVLRGNIKSSSVLILLGCHLNEFKIHFESKFTEGMTWNHFLAGKIHIDHIRPCIDFDLSKSDQQNLCFHYTNLQPLWARDNLKKGAKRLLT